MQGEKESKRGGPPRYGREAVIAYEVLTGKRRLRKGEAFTGMAFERFTGISRRTLNKFRDDPEYRNEVYERKSPPAWVQKEGIMERVVALEEIVASLREKGIIATSEGAAEAPEGAPANERERTEPDPTPPIEGAADGGPGGGPGGDGEPGDGAIEEGSAEPGDGAIEGGSAEPGPGFFTVTDD